MNNLTPALNIFAATDVTCYLHLVHIININFINEWINVVFNIVYFELGGDVYKIKRKKLYLLINYNYSQYRKNDLFYYNFKIN